MTFTIQICDCHKVLEKLKHMEGLLMSQKDDLDSLVATLTQTTSSIKDGLTGLGTAIQAVLAKIQGSSTPVDLTSELTAIGSAVTSLGDAGTALQSAVTQLNAAISTPPPAAQ